MRGGGRGGTQAATQQLHSSHAAARQQPRSSQAAARQRVQYGERGSAGAGIAHPAANLFGVCMGLPPCSPRHTACECHAWGAEASVHGLARKGWPGCGMKRLPDLWPPLPCVVKALNAINSAMHTWRGWQRRRAVWLPAHLAALHAAACSHILWEPCLPDQPRSNQGQQERKQICPTFYFTIAHLAPNVSDRHPNGRMTSVRRPPLEKCDFRHSFDVDGAKFPRALCL